MAGHIDFILARFVTISFFRASFVIRFGSDGGGNANEVNPANGNRQRQESPPIGGVVLNLKAIFEVQNSIKFVNPALQNCHHL